MSKIIEIKNLKRYYQVHDKEPGFKGSIKSFVSRKYYDVKAVDDISFSIGKGELVGFIGPNGAGKTTTLKVCSGLLHPTSGFVSVLGYQPWNRNYEFLKQITLVLGQKNQLSWDLPAYDSFLLNKEIFNISDKEFKKTLRNLVELLELDEVLKVQVRKLSLGQRMKCELVAALLHKPKVVFLDEPTIGLDVVMQKRIRDFIRRYNKKYEATIILTSHYMEDVKELCDRVVIISSGKLLFDGRLEDVVEKFAKRKELNVIFSKRVNLTELKKIGKIEEYEYPRARLLIERAKIAEKASRLLAQFPVEDLEIGEMKIEEIVRKIFEKEGE